MAAVNQKGKQPISRDSGAMANRRPLQTQNVPVARRSVAREPDVTVSGANLQWRPAAIKLAAHLIAADGTRNGDGKIHVNSSIAGARVQVRREVFWKAQFDAAVAGVKRPSDLRFGAGLDFRPDAAIAGAHF